MKFSELCQSREICFDKPGHLTVSPMLKPRSLLKIEPALEYRFVSVENLKALLPAA